MFTSRAVVWGRLPKQLDKRQAEETSIELNALHLKIRLYDGVINSPESPKLHLEALDGDVEEAGLPVFRRRQGHPSCMLARHEDT